MRKPPLVTQVRLPIQAQKGRLRSRAWQKLCKTTVQTAFLSRPSVGSAWVWPQLGWRLLPVAMMAFHRQARRH